MIQGVHSAWGAAKATLIIMTDRSHYTVVLAQAVQQELQRNVTGDAAIELAGWLRRIRLERRPSLPLDELRTYESTLLPVLRHLNDLPAAAAAVQARPDWVISSNRAHWNEALAERTGLRIVTPQDFMSRMRPLE